jgi:hypothetical protein
MTPDTCQFARSRRSARAHVHGTTYYSYGSWTAQYALPSKAHTTQAQNRYDHPDGYSSLPHVC